MSATTTTMMRPCQRLERLDNIGVRRLLNAHPQTRFMLPPRLDLPAHEKGDERCMGCAACGLQVHGSMRSLVLGDDDAAPAAASSAAGSSQGKGKKGKGKGKGKGGKKGR